MFEFPERSLAMGILHLLHDRQICGQSSDELNAKGLLVKNGGLCGPTTMALILDAARRTHRTYTLNGYDHGAALIERIVAWMSEKSGFDARRGTSTQDDIHFLRHLNSSGVGSHRLEFLLINSPSIEDLKMHPSEVAKVSVGSPGRSHAMILLGYSEKLNMALLFDPNNSAHLIRAKIQASSNKIHFLATASTRYLGESYYLKNMIKIRIGELEQLTPEIIEKISR